MIKTGDVLQLLPLCCRSVNKALLCIRGCYGDIDSPLGVILRFGEGRRFGKGDGLLQRPLQVGHSLLDHLPDVLDPFLFDLHAGGLEEEEEEATL